MAQIRENEKIKRMTLQREIARRERCKMIVEKMTKQAKILSAKYLKSVVLKDFDEISRRFSMLNEPFISICMQRVNFVLQDLEISVSTATWMKKLLSVMTQAVIVAPKIGPTKCVLVHERVAEFMARTITQIKNERLKRIRDNWSGNKQKAFSTSDGNELKSKRVIIGDCTQYIESPFSYDEFIGNMKTISARKSEKTVRISNASNHNKNLKY